MLLLFSSYLFVFHVLSTPLDICVRNYQNCEACVNSTDIFGQRCVWCITNNRCGTIQSIECDSDDATLHVYNCPGDVNNFIYDEQFMREIATPLIASTNAPNMEILSSVLNSCFKDNANVYNTYEIFCDEDNVTTCYAYSVYLKRENAFAMIFRGTSTIFQLIDEGISFFLRRKVDFLETGGVVDSYYLNGFRNLWKRNLKRDFETLYNRNPDANFWFFGHSLGGGLASIGSMMIQKKYNIPKNQVKLVTFGMPRIGDIELAMAHDEAIPDSIRIVNSRDPIPALPPRTYPDTINSGSFHHSREVWYPNGMSQGAVYIIGNRPDTNIGRSLIPFNIDHHFKYFDAVLEDWYKTGCRKITIN
ncbi:unnamed protein product [Caenorhabditis bovis]|uniref:Fungal lipase-type domain-containing protein n=1 Tax=Caenorhabditis bovis TaxID=2654633 RepID=A0A8S1EHL0_9PELO|nr:unnamed protein product [Caenorhabditis bovis]